MLDEMTGQVSLANNNTSQMLLVLLHQNRSTNTKCLLLNITQLRSSTCCDVRSPNNSKNEIRNGKCPSNVPSNGKCSPSISRAGRHPTLTPPQPLYPHTILAPPQHPLTRPVIKSVVKPMTPIVTMARISKVNASIDECL